MSNPFSAFLSDDDSFVLPEKTEAKKKKVVTRKPAAKPVKTSAPQPVTNKRQTPRRQTNVIEPSAVGRDNRRSRGRGRGGGRAPRPGDVDKRGKRYFDRHSGSGRGRGTKKGGSGGHNWGNKIESQYNTNVSISPNNQEKTEEKENKDETADGDKEPKTEGTEGEEKAEEPKEPEKETFTFDQYLKQKAEKRAGAGFENLSLAEVDKIKEGRAYTKSEKATEYLFEPQMIKTKREKKSSKSSQMRKVDDVGFTVKQPDRGHRSYRGRGRGRGRGNFHGRGRGRNRSYANRNRVDVDTNDQRTFPQLGA